MPSVDNIDGIYTQFDASYAKFMYKFVADSDQKGKLLKLHETMLKGKV